MIITILITSCLTLIAINIFFLLNVKSNRATLKTIATLEEVIAKNIENTKSEILLKVQELNTQINSNIDISKNEVQTIIVGNYKIIHEELISNTKEMIIDNFNTIESSKKSVLESLELKVNELKTDTDQYLQKLSTDISSKVDSTTQIYEKQQTELVNEVKGKFSKIIEEIKRPLTLD